MIVAEDSHAHVVLAILNGQNINVRCVDRRPTHARAQVDAPCLEPLRLFPGHSTLLQLSGRGHVALLRKNQEELDRPFPPLRLHRRILDFEQGLRYIRHRRVGIEGHI